MVHSSHDEVDVECAADNNDDGSARQLHSLNRGEMYDAARKDCNASRARFPSPPHVASSAAIHALPSELIEHILAFGDPVDVVSPFSQTCRAYHALVAADSHLWRTLYLLQELDDPRRCLTPLGRPYFASAFHSSQAFPWATQLKRIMRARAVCAKIEIARPGEMRAVLETLLELVSNVPPAHPGDSSALSLNLIWVAATLTRSDLLDADADKLGLSREEEALRARLHTCYGVTDADRTPAARVASRGRVYSMRNYTFENAFGPFVPLPDPELFGDQNASGRAGRESEPGLGVDWEHMQALHHVMSMHVVDLREEDEVVYVVFPLSMPYCQSVIPRGMDLDVERDWAGVEGVWHVAFAFCDHRELLVYNNFSVDAGPLDTSIFEEPDFMEAFRSFHVAMRILGTEDDPQHPGRPKIKFGGDVDGHATMVGHVELGPDDHIRWSFVSGVNPDAIRFSSEGVQVGGVRSSFGVLGAWTTTTHELGDPVGPFWLRKVPDNELPHLLDEAER
ncbi:hypothetical protein PUNSTDRAFT_98672 [Punctularia strigosozonata HHB-11173 SS5]|uniref:uncharacterized protein n=1 Tax=Punctularia strigosozonata (strain HHB-11173) TaxID=741275 RepID=UPI000441842C|nr:uncharacterized protein PUNSTDRAFT_98672 [Punctularia strigosozonata HHB-11173 SS5]EIN11540.1 hypothetical protein PUNSTDRAFT_98672 [Punctularia strigosozonata HHB-11173 SS5]